MDFFDPFEPVIPYPSDLEPETNWVWDEDHQQFIFTSPISFSDF